MSFMNIIGGLGAGVTQGLQNMQAIENQRTNTAMAKERQAMLKDEFDAKKTERQRAEDLSKLRTDLYQQYPDADRYQVESMFAEQAVKAGKLRGEELDNAFNAVERLKQQFGAKAYDAMRAGDIKPLQQVLGERGIAVDFTPDGKGLQMWRDGGARDDQGNLVAQTLPLEGLLQMDAFATTRQRLAEQAKLSQDSRKTESEIAKNAAQAGNYKAQAAGRTPYLEGPGGQLYPNPAFSGGKSGDSRSGGGSIDDGMLSPEDFGKAAEKYVGAETEFDMARAYTLYTNMLENTRTANGQPMSPGQRAAAFEDALRIARGEGVQTPDLRDGRLALTATIDGRSYVIDPDYTEMQALSLKDADGNPRYTAQTIDSIYMDAMRTGAVSNPQQFGAVWQIVNDPAALAEAQQRHKQGDARMGDILRAASVIQRGIARANETTKPGRNPEFSRIFNSLEKPGGMLGTSGAFTDAVRDATR